MEKREKVIFNKCYTILSKNFSDYQTDAIYLDSLVNYDTLKKDCLLEMYKNNNSNFNFNIIMIVMALYQSLLQNAISWETSKKIILEILTKSCNIYLKTKKWLYGNIYFDLLEKNNCIVLAPIFNRRDYELHWFL
ncbi:hypothetical protein [uncultured Acetobacterium sp.]|uniref:hypothetical protein n=1 Tax=uncultured Acetobacterium sp. TaxID=217139 RepID=UPI0025D476B9|nr:hypothetical protein [uncultured Acetobacterium sp.]